MRSPGAAIRRLLIVLAVVIIAVYTIIQAIERPAGGDTQTYRAEFSDVFGLRVNADVRVRGVQVGKVTELDTQRSGTPVVTFTVQKNHALTGANRLAIKFQNLVGQRYLAVTDGQGDSDEKVDPSRLIPTTMTTGSFDITNLFNGLRPLLQGADPNVFNTFATNLLHLLQGDDGVGLGTVLADVDRLTTFASDKKALISVIIDNLGTISQQLQGKSEIINSLLKNLRTLFDVLEKNIELIKSAFDVGAKNFPPVAEVLGHVFDLGLGGRDRVSQRLLELPVDTTQLTETLSILPAVLSTIDQTPQQVPGADDRCSKGRATLPGLGDVLLSGGRLTLCRS